MSSILEGPHGQFVEEATLRPRRCSLPQLLRLQQSLEVSFFVRPVLRNVTRIACALPFHGFEEKGRHVRDRPVGEVAPHITLLSAGSPDALNGPALRHSKRITGIEDNGGISHLRLDNGQHFPPRPGRLDEAVEGTHEDTRLRIDGTNPSEPLLHLCCRCWWPGVFCAKLGAQRKALDSRAVGRSNPSITKRLEEQQGLCARGPVDPAVRLGDPR
mmetsp:Transcript_45705/g.99312  ORF Transcript_45705/g.99312 Transcript_45705/m.99312 type:complete len:215 (+) Transcript_45705:857-1501(+)